jgi:Clp amino terminal domain, pathogenicity island component
VGQRRAAEECRADQRVLTLGRLSLSWQGGSVLLGLLREDRTHAAEALESLGVTEHILLGLMRENEGVACRSCWTAKLIWLTFATSCGGVSAYPLFPEDT